MLEVLGAEVEEKESAKTTVVVNMKRSMLRDVLVTILGGVGTGITLMLINKRRAR